ncbi:MAG: hypothetical protein ACT4QF_19385 [Sporichthyaceae bacterium]
MPKVVKVTRAEVMAAKELVRRYELGIDNEDPGLEVRWVANALPPDPEADAAGA